MFIIQIYLKSYDSRTFCLYEDVKKLQSMGFALGGSLNNAIVVKDDEVLK